jgi:flavin-dependent dehydrogenase
VQGSSPASFDGYLLAMACQQGAQHIPGRVRLVEYQDRPVVHTAQESYTADLLVLATGVNSNSPLSPAFGYQRPATELMAQDEVLRPPSWPADEVRVFFRQPPGIVFGALIPKGQYVNISLYKRGLTQDSISEFLDANGLDTQFEPEMSRLCGCNPRIAVGSARTYFGDRWVAVGDAAVSRLYKDGNGSAFFTAQRAMYAALRLGISRTAFQKGYAFLCRQISIDNFYGRLLFWGWDLALRSPFLLNTWKKALQQEANLSPEKRIHMRILWGMFTGDEFYKDLFMLFFHRSAVHGLWQGLRRRQA